MAKKPENKPAKNSEAKPPRRKGGMAKFFYLLIFGLAAPFCLPTLLLCLALLPTLVVLITDRDPEHSAAATIGFMNFAGLTPFLIDLWLKGQTWEAAFAIMREPTNWMIMLGGAAIGQLILYAVPPVMLTFTVASLEHRMKRLNEGLEQLKITWGPDVGNPKAAPR